ncbi:MAG: SxtJ family membrane protein [Pseudomonadota bacterium]
MKKTSERSGNVTIQMGSERSFGLVFTAVFLIIALWPVVFHGGGIRIVSLVLGLVTLVVTLGRPSLLAVPNYWWFRFGMLLSKLMAPIAMGIIFFLVVTPVGLIRRLRNRDPLNQKLDASRESYWIIRSEETHPVTGMTKQF